MYYNKRNGFYRHYKCATVEGRNTRRNKSALCETVKISHKNPPGIGKCKSCKGYDLKTSFDYLNREHTHCEKLRHRNSTKMKPHKTDTCAFTGLPFSSKAEMKPVGDHDHDTLLYRGHIWSAANRLEGAAKFIMNEAGWTVDELCEALKTYLAKPGIDIGLEPYPQLGFATADEAIKHYETTN
jgi:hypothetical protein